MFKLYCIFLLITDLELEIQLVPFFSTVRALKHNICTYLDTSTWISVIYVQGCPNRGGLGGLSPPCLCIGGARGGLKLPFLSKKMPFFGKRCPFYWKICPFRESAPPALILFRHPCLRILGSVNVGGPTTAQLFSIRFLYKLIVRHELSIPFRQRRPESYFIFSILNCLRNRK